MLERKGLAIVAHLVRYGLTKVPTRLRRVLDVSQYDVLNNGTRLPQDFRYSILSLYMALQESLKNI